MRPIDAPLLLLLRLLLFALPPWDPSPGISEGPTWCREGTSPWLVRLLFFCL